MCCAVRAAVIADALAFYDMPQLVPIQEATWNVITEAPQWYRDWLNAKVLEWTAGMDTDED
jgi:hypothetical protein